MDADGKAPSRPTRIGILIGSTGGGCLIGAILLRLRHPGDPTGHFTGGMFGGITVVVVAAVVLCVGDFIRKQDVAEFNGNGAVGHDASNEHGNE